MAKFKIIPILGLKTSVPQDDYSLFRPLGEGIAYTHDTGGINVDYQRKHNTATKAYGYTKYANSANAQATRCMGLFELETGTTRDYIFFDNGKVYYLDSSLDPIEITASPAVTFANGLADYYSIIRIGSYVVWADMATTTPYKWANGDANSSKLIANGTEYKFRYIESFQRRVIGAYSDQTNGEFEIRWSTSWPGTAITALNFPAANQGYVPNDDLIVGVKRMGRNRCFIYCNDSIHSLDYLANFSLPFALRNIVSSQGAESNISIVDLGDRHYFFNRNYGFVEFRGGEFPYGGRPISEDIEKDLQNINVDSMNTIMGKYIPLTREICWTGAFDGGTTPTHLYFYHIDKKTWRKEDKVMRCIDVWRLYSLYTWNDFVTEIGGTGIWTDAGTSTWSDYTQTKTRLVMANNDGWLYYHFGEDLNGSNIDGYRIEPIMDFGDATRPDLLEEIWFQFGLTGNFSIDVYHRSGDTVGEVIADSWTALPSISMNSPADPKVDCGETARLHQIKWGTDLKDEKYEVNRIEFNFEPGGQY
jgi:hypothetical protein